MKDKMNLDFSFEKFLAPAKLNLFLKIKNKRTDGYHNLQSVFQLISLYDEISIRVRDDNKINFKNSNPLIPKEKDIAYKACILLLDKMSIGVDIEIKKNIPIGSGLGGGSSDAATILMAINRICHLGLSKTNLMQLGLELGADVPFFIFGKNAWVEGIGDQLYPISIPDFDYVVAVPNISIPTSSIFASFKLTNNANPLKIATLFDSICRSLKPRAVKRAFTIHSNVGFSPGFTAAIYFCFQIRTHLPSSMLSASPRFIRLNVLSSNHLRSSISLAASTSDLCRASSSLVRVRASRSITHSTLESDTRKTRRSPSINSSLQKSGHS